jgi:hypothetical protein
LLQWQGWRSTGLAPPPYPVGSQESESRVKPAPFRGLGVSAILGQVHGVTGLTPAALQVPPHSDGDGLLPGELVRRHRGASPRRMMAPSRRCQGVKCPCTGAGARVRGAIERGGPRSRAGRTLGRGGTCSRGSEPSSEAEPARGKCCPSNGAESARGGARPRARRSLLEGISKRAALVGRRGPCGVGCSLHG